MRRKVSWFFRAFSASCAAACIAAPGCGLLPGLIGDANTLVFDFREGRQGWEVIFADFEPGQTNSVAALTEIRALPSELGVAGTGLRVAGTNVSDDLIMLLTRKLDARDGIRANTRYRVSYWIVLASNAPTDCVGIGGAPGEAVSLKAGAAPFAPAAAVDTTDGVIRLNMDFGVQTTGGRNASVVSNIANGVPCEAVGDFDDAPYVSLVRAHTHRQEIVSNANGELWLVVGTDSGFEGRTDLYFQRIEATLESLGELPDLSGG